MSYYCFNQWIFQPYKLSKSSSISLGNFILFPERLAHTIVFTAPIVIFQRLKMLASILSATFLSTSFVAYRPLLYDFSCPSKRSRLCRLLNYCTFTPLTPIRDLPLHKLTHRIDDPVVMYLSNLLASFFLAYAR
jgi:hypothetical protein